MQPDRNPAAQIQPAAKRCLDCGEPKPTSAFYERGDGHLSTYCKHHQRERSRVSYRRRRQNPDELARMRAVERARKAASRARLRAVDPGRELRLARSRAAAARQLIAAHLDEYRALLKTERQQQQQHDAEVASGGGPDAA
jgi:recombinational DNA repair protein (RecF pathway)